MQPTRLFILTTLGLLAGYCCFRVYNAETRSHQLRADEMELSSITYGLFNPDEWKNFLTDILTKKIQDFQITDSNRAQLKQQMVDMLTKVVNEIEKVMKESNRKHGFTGLVRGVLTGVLVDVKDIKAGIPRYADQILDYLNDPKSRDELKDFVLARVDSMAAKTAGMVDYSLYNAALARYGMTDKHACINGLRAKRAQAEAELGV